jgi:hypothetical protein
LIDKEKAPQLRGFFLANTNWNYFFATIDFTIGAFSIFVAEA